MNAADVLIVNWNGREQTLTCLDEVFAQIDAIAATHTVGVIVTDNGSTDGSVAAIRARHARIRIVELDENRGFTGGVHAAVAASTAQNLIFLNNDALPEEGWLAAFLEAIATAGDDVAAVGGRIIDLTGTLIDFIGGAMTFDGHAFQPGFHMPLGSREEPANGGDLLFACGGNMLVRRDAFLALGGFDDDYFAYLEDVDFGWRSWIAGHRHTYAPRATVRHASSATSARLGNFERGVLFERNALQTVMKNYEGELLREAGASIFFTYLHRLHHYVTTRNGNVEELARPPFTAEHELPDDGVRPLWQRVKRRIRRELAERWFPDTLADTPLATIDDPLTAMQFRALDWILRNQGHLAEKRSNVQRMRLRSDREIFERFPLLVVPTYPGDAELMASAFFRDLRPQIPTIDRTLGDIMRT